jgi:MerR family transcriptional regulator, copper efflux regulator
LHPQRASNRYRHYDGRTVVRVRNIRLLLSLGFTADDIRAFLPCLDLDIGDGRACPASAPVVAEKLATLEERIAALGQLRDRLEAFLHRVRGEAPGAVDQRATGDQQTSRPR